MTSNAKYWVLVAKRGKHSYLILGKGQQITSTFGFADMVNGKFELLNENGILKMDPEKQKLFTYKEQENDYPTVPYKGFELKSRAV